MKVERERPEPFIPIRITLETLDEALVIYHMLNCGAAQSLNDYSRNKDIPFMGHLKTEIFHEYLKVFQV